MMSWDKVKNCFKDICQHKVLSLIISMGVIAVIFCIICIFDHELFVKCKIFIMKDKFKNFIELIKGVGWIIGGSIGLIILEDKFNLADKTHALEKEKEANQKQIADQNHKLELKKEVNQRYAKAVELLGNENKATRIGALYTLEQILKEDEENYYDSCMDIIAGYVKRYLKENEGIEKKLRAENEFREIRMEQIEDIIHYCDLDSNSYSDLNMEYCELRAKGTLRRKFSEEIVTAINILSRHSKENKKIKLNSIKLDYVDFSETDIEFKNIDFSNSKFIGADLFEKKFLDCNLTKTNFTNTSLFLATLEKVDLTKTYFIETYMEGITIIEASNWDTALFEDINMTNIFTDDKDLEIKIKQNSKK